MYIHEYEYKHMYRQIASGVYALASRRKKPVIFFFCISLKPRVE